MLSWPEVGFVKMVWNTTGAVFQPDPTRTAVRSVAPCGPMSDSV